MVTGAQNTGAQGAAISAKVLQGLQEIQGATGASAQVHQDLH